MSNTPFDASQIASIKDGLFGIIADDFNWSLSESKRKAAISKWLKAKNYDALIQRTKSAAKAEGVTGNPYATRRLNPIHLTAGDIRYVAGLFDVEPVALFSGQRFELQVEVLKTLGTGELCREKDFKLANKPLSNVSPAFAAVLIELFGSSDILPKGERGCLEISSQIPRGEFHSFSPKDASAENCLAGRMCPSCGSESAFFIDTIGVNADDVDPMLSQSGVMRGLSYGDIKPVSVWALFTDSGSEDVVGDSEDDENGVTECRDCGYDGDTAEFFAVHDEDWDA